MNAPDVDTVPDDSPLRDMRSGLTSPTRAATARNAMGHTAACAIDSHDVAATTPTKPARPRQHTTAT